jgi:hypothetical protein
MPAVVTERLIVMVPLVAKRPLRPVLVRDRATVAILVGSFALSEGSKKRRHHEPEDE